MKKETEPRRQRNIVRIQLDLTPKALDQLDDINKNTESITRIETIRKSIAIHAFLARRVAEGKDIHISAEDLKNLVEGTVAVYGVEPPKAEKSPTKDPSSSI